MNMPVEYFGTAASVIVAVSLTQKNIKRLRILNLVGAAAFSVYGLFISAWPVLGLNAFICVIDLYYLIAMKKKKNYFELLQIDNPEESVYLKKFIDFYGADIKHFIPHFDGKLSKGTKAVFVLRDLMPASLVVYRVLSDEIEILLDYAIPEYRDMKSAAYFFEKIEESMQAEKSIYFTKPGNKIYNKYLEKSGFRYNDERNVYTLGREE